MPDALPEALHVLVPTDLIFVRPVRKMVEGLLAGQGWVEDQIDDVALILTEVVQNAVEHGSRCDGTERVEVRVRVDADGCTLEITDPGTGKDPQIALDRDVTQPPDLTAARGRGLFLIHRLATRFERDRAGSGGLLVCVRRAMEAP